MLDETQPILSSQRKIENDLTQMRSQGINTTTGKGHVQRACVGISLQMQVLECAAGRVNQGGVGTRWDVNLVLKVDWSQAGGGGRSRWRQEECWRPFVERNWVAGAVGLSRGSPGRGVVIVGDHAAQLGEWI